ncbi:MAG: cytochrome c oxidase subunit II [Gemmatimonadota bacterium]|nr:MAG: cytochrome c oxidase subunit II [Gemmatimonadota bacterium]
MGWLPGAASTYAADLDRIFYVILAVTGLVFIGVEATLIYFLWKYRGREGRKAAYIEGSNKAEIIWTVTPAVFIVGLAVASQSVWSKIKSPANFPTDAIEYRVEARQYAWGITYAGADGVLGTEDDFTRFNEMHVPVGQPVSFELTSADVIHSFFVPAFRIKQDAVPGLIMRVWFEATEVGEFALACAELCGVAHFNMGGKVIVHPQDEFERWVAEQS